MTKKKEIMQSVPGIYSGASTLFPRRELARLRKIERKEERENNGRKGGKIHRVCYTGDYSHRSTELFQARN